METKNTPAGGGDVDRIVAILKELLVAEINVAVPVDQIDENASLEHDLHIDSVAMVEIIAAVESRFDFMFLDSDLVSSSFATLKNLAAVIAERVSAPSPP